MECLPSMYKALGYKHTHILLLSVFCNLGNHSCVPNAETSFPENNFLLHVTALEDIKPGEVRGPGSRGGHKGLAASLYEAAVTGWKPLCWDGGKSPQAPGPESFWQ